MSLVRPAPFACSPSRHVTAALARFAFCHYSRSGKNRKPWVPDGRPLHTDSQGMVRSSETELSCRTGFGTSRVVRELDCGEYVFCWFLGQPLSIHQHHIRSASWRSYPQLFDTTHLLMTSMQRRVGAACCTSMNSLSGCIGLVFTDDASKSRHLTLARRWMRKCGLDAHRRRWKETLISRFCDEVPWWGDGLRAQLTDDSPRMLIYRKHSAEEKVDLLPEGPFSGCGALSGTVAGNAVPSLQRLLEASLRSRRSSDLGRGRR